MAQILVRNIDDSVKERLRRRAHDHGRSLEEEARMILDDAAKAANDAVGTETAIQGTSEEGWATRASQMFKDVGFTKEEADALELRGWDIRPVDLE